MAKRACAILLVSALLIASCASTPSAPYSPLEKVPASFLAAYPSGTQTRRPDDIQRTFAANRSIYYRVFKKAIEVRAQQSGDIDIAVALKPDGSVEGVALLGSSTTDAAFGRSVAEATFQLNFGPTQGEGFYVFWYPLHFRTSHT